VLQEFEVATARVIAERDEKLARKAQRRLEAEVRREAVRYGAFGARCGSGGWMDTTVVGIVCSLLTGKRTWALAGWLQTGGSRC